MTKEEIFDAVRTKRMTKFANKMKVVNSTIVYEAMQDYADQETVSLQSENESLKAALKELVEVEDMKDQIRIRKLAGMPSGEDVADRKSLIESYEKRKPLAWENARKLLNT